MGDRLSLLFLWRCFYGDALNWADLSRGMKLAVEHAFNRLSLAEMALSDRSYFVWVHSAVPDFFR
jgi:hypothetical protein